MNSVLASIFNSPNHEYVIKEVDIDTSHKLTWNESLGIGLIPSNKSDGDVYSEDYWNYYRSLINTEIGKNLTKARIDIANKFNISPLKILDIGIGNGQFCDEFKCRGYDVNPYAVEYLKKNKKYVDVYAENFIWEWISLHDVIEHIYDADILLSKCKNVMLSTPIYNNIDDCLISPHLKPDEHILYFTISGIIHYMSFYGFNCKYYSTVESKCGRRSIGSFIFKRL